MLELERQQPGLNAKFVGLARAMRSYDPDADSWRQGDPDAEAASCRDAVWAFSLPYEGQLVQQAAALGLIVYGEQIGTAFLPDAPSRGARKVET